MQPEEGINISHIHPKQVCAELVHNIVLFFHGLLGSVSFYEGAVVF